MHPNGENLVRLILQEIVKKNCSLQYINDQYDPSSEMAFDGLYKHLCYYTVSIWHNSIPTNDHIKQIYIEHYEYDTYAEMKITLLEFLCYYYYDSHKDNIDFLSKVLYAVLMKLNFDMTYEEYFDNKIQSIMKYLFSETSYSCCIKDTYKEKLIIDYINSNIDDVYVVVIGTCDDFYEDLMEVVNNRNMDDLCMDMDKIKL